MGRPFKRYPFRPGQLVYVCQNCHNQIARMDSVISSHFRGRLGTGLFMEDALVNVLEEEDDPEERQMLTGLHVVHNCRCIDCGQLLGWRYISTKETGQEYKLGKYVLEQSLLSIQEVTTG